MCLRGEPSPPPQPFSQRDSRWRVACGPISRRAVAAHTQGPPRPSGGWPRLYLVCRIAAQTNWQWRCLIWPKDEPPSSGLPLLSSCARAVPFFDYHELTWSSICDYHKIEPEGKQNLPPSSNPSQAKE